MAHCLNKAVEAELRSIAGNNTCCDCDSKSPQWASVSFGVFMCLECSGRHRSLGVHVSFVRSVSMDSWSEKQIQMMRSGGNNKCNAFLQQYNVAKETSIPTKYNAPAAQLYRDRLLAEVDGRPLPTELPKATSNATAGGTDPLPGESEEDYVARQRRLQAEARERLKAKFGGSNGLSSGGKSTMTGIGSDSSYRPGGGGGGSGMLGGIKTEEVTAQLAEVSQKAVSWLSTGIAVIGERVGKATEELRKPQNKNTTTYMSQDSYGNDDERSMGFHNNENISMAASRSAHERSSVGSSSSGSGGNYDYRQDNAPASRQTNATNGANGGAASKDAISKSWSFLAAGAADLWAKAAEATNDIIKNVVEDDDLKFPRPAEVGPPPVSTDTANAPNASVSGGSTVGGGNTSRTLPPPQKREQPFSPTVENERDYENDKKRQGKNSTGLSLGGLTGSGQKNKKEPLAKAIYTDEDDDDGRATTISTSLIHTTLTNLYLQTRPQQFHCPLLVERNLPRCLRSREKSCPPSQ